MKELGWIVATKRRDGKPPSFVKGSSDCYVGEAVYVFPVEADARRYHEELGVETGSAFAVFQVAIEVKAPPRASKKKGA